MNKISLLVAVLALTPNFAGAAETPVAAAVNPFAARIAALHRDHAALLADIKKLDVSKLSKEQQAEKAVYDKDLAEIAKAFSRDLKEEELGRFEKTLAIHRKTVERHKLAVRNPFAARIAALRRDHAALIADIRKIDATKLSKEQQAEKAVYDKDLDEVSKAFSRDLKDEELKRYEKMLVDHRKTVERHKAALKLLKP